MISRFHLSKVQYYETDDGLTILCQTCAERRAQQGETCEWFDTLENVGQLFDLIQCEDCDAPPTPYSPRSVPTPLSIFDIFTEVQLRMTADGSTELAEVLTANHEQHVRQLAAQMGLDPDEAWAEAQKLRVEMTCPACGPKSWRTFAREPATMTLMCRGCGGSAFSDYEDDELDEARQHLLDLPVGTPETRQYAAAHAFNPGGCMVCPGCIEQTLTNDRICPLLWIISPGTASYYLATYTSEKYEHITHLWVDVLADGPATVWRFHLFNHAIPAALQSFINRHQLGGDSPIR
jgi:hypothetical protein